MTDINLCPDCANENKYCDLHQANEKAVYESAIYAGKHDTVEFRIALHNARTKDMESI